MAGSLPVVNCNIITGTGGVSTKHWGTEYRANLVCLIIDLFLNLGSSTRCLLDGYFCVIMIKNLLIDCHLLSRRDFFIK